MRETILKHLILLSLIPYLFLGCVTQEKASSMKAIELINAVKHVSIEDESRDKTSEPATYGQYTDEIQEFLSTTPLGSEIYLEQKKSGEWYLKVEKTFTVQKDEEEKKIAEPIYAESILI